MTINMQLIATIVAHSRSAAYESIRSFALNYRCFTDVSNKRIRSRMAARVALFP
jgi:hypothetical protein